MFNQDANVLCSPTKIEPPDEGRRAFTFVFQIGLLLSAGVFLMSSIKKKCLTEEHEKVHEPAQTNEAKRLQGMLKRIPRSL